MKIKLEERDKESVTMTVHDQVTGNVYWVQIYDNGMLSFCEDDLKKGHNGIRDAHGIWMQYPTDPEAKQILEMFI